MSILIKGAKIPNNCVMCFYINECKAIGGGMTPEQIHSCTEQRHERCPLVEIPPHGRLIDADKLKNDIPEADADCFENCRDCTLLHQEDVWDIIDDAPTIIESEEQEHE